MADERPIDSVWTRPPRRRRGDDQTLSREQIVTEAIKLLDAEGLESLSMRKLGARLNAGATSLYWHVANKDELIELVIDRVYGEIEVPAIESGGDWRGAIEHMSHSIRNVILRHRWFASVLGEAGLASFGPSTMRMMDSALAVFEAGGFSLEEADQALNVVAAFVVGMATSEAAALTTLARSGRTEEEWVEGIWPLLQQVAQDYPRLLKLFDRQRSPDPETVRQGAFEYGLDRVLDGLAARP
jgi:AcrR family transcriptional regulator